MTTAARRKHTRVKPTSSRNAGAGRHQIRIIGGQWKRTPLAVPETTGLRPTPDRVRETLFNWLGFLFHNDWTSLRCLDLFAGSGALGFEAASRGAAHVTLVEQAAPALQCIEAARTKLQAEQIVVVRADVRRFLRQSRPQAAPCFNLIFLDPPYGQKLVPQLLPDCANWLCPGGILYVELEYALEADALPEWLQGWEVLRADRAGQVFFHLLVRQESAGNEA